MEEKLVTIAEYEDYIEAEMARQLLEDNGIKAVVTGDNASSVYSGFPTVGGYCKLETMESDAQQAKEILESQQQFQEENYNEDLKDLEDYDDYDDEQEYDEEDYDEEEDEL